MLVTLVCDEVVDSVNDVANNDADDLADELEVVGVRVEEPSKARLAVGWSSLATKGLE